MLTAQSPARTASSLYIHFKASLAATPKQIQFLQTMARRCKLNDRQLENRIAEIVGRPSNVQALTKKEAGLVLDNLTGGGTRTGG